VTTLTLLRRDMKSTLTEVEDGALCSSDSTFVDEAYEPFANSSEHLFAELERVDLLINAEVAHLREVQSVDEQFRGLYISEQDVDSLLEQPLGRPHWLMRDDKRPGQLDARLEDLRRRIEGRKLLSLQRGIVLRLDTLQRMFELDRLEIDALLICMAIELDLRYERLYAYLQDDVTKKKPSVDLVLNLLSSSVDTKLIARERFFFACSPSSASSFWKVLE